jgi:hypothetical protein
MKRILLFGLLLTSFIAQAQFNYFKGVLSGANEATPNTSTATGVVIVKYNNINNMLELFGHYRGLSSTITGSHIHEAPIGSEGPIRVTVTNTGGTTGSLTAIATLTDAQEAQLLLEGMYVNVHSTDFPGGEIRTQLTFPSGQTDFLTARLQGAQEVPPTPSTAMGRAVVLLDRGEDSLYVTGNYNGLSAEVNGSHIHQAPPGVAGPILLNLTNTGGTSGVLELVAQVTAAQETQIATGGAYVNVHSTTFPGGEIRGQIFNSSQLTFFAGALTGGNQAPTPVTTNAMGTVIVRYDPSTNMLELTGDYQGLSSTITSATLNGPAPYNANGPVITSMTQTGGTTGTLTLSAILSDEREADLYSGLLYVNVTTNDFNQGEIRVQLYNTSVGQSYYFTGNLQGSQEVPQVNTTGIGTVTSLLDARTGIVFVTGSFSGLSSNATMAHIHQALPGQTGPPIVTLSVSMATSGTVTGSDTLTGDQVVAMINGGTYVNIHSETFPNGELRAQLGNLVLPLKLLTFNASREREKVALSWTTAQEKDMVSYEVEQQHPASGAWTKKGTVAASGAGASTTYRFSDVPLTGNSAVLLYRLKMNETGGVARYSNIIKVSYQAGRGALTLLSNPVRNGVLRFVVTGLTNLQKAEASVVDQSGRVVARTQASLLTNNEIPVSHLSSGMYRLVIRAGSETLQESFVK